MSWFPGFNGVTGSWQRRLTWIACLLYLAHALLYLTWFIDDAAISFTYARNLGNGDGLVLFPGTERVEAYSNPLWVFLLAPFSALGANLFVVAKSLALLFGLGAIVGTSVLGTRLADQRTDHTSPRDPLPLGALAALLLAIHPPFVIWTTSGLEGSLYACLLVWATVCLIDEAEASAHLPLSALLFMLVALTRPEGIMYAITAAIVRLWWALRSDRQIGLSAFKTWIGWGLVFLLPWGLYQLWHHQYFASFVTNTFYAKRPHDPLIERLLNPRSSGWRYVLGWVKTYKLSFLVPLALIPLLKPACWGADRARGWLLVASLGAAAIFFPLYADGDWMGQYRFMIPAEPFVFLLMCAGALELLGHLPDAWQARNGRRPALTSLLLGGVGLYLVVHGTPLALAFHAKPEVGVADVQKRAEFFKTVRERLQLEGDVVLLDPDLGATSFFSGMRVIDTWGLADVSFAKHQYNQAFVANYVLNEIKPAFVHVFHYWNRQVHMTDEPDFKTQYVPLPSYRTRVGTLDGGNWVRRSLLTAGPGDYPRDLPPLMRFDNGLELVHADLDRKAVLAGGQAGLTLFWRKTRAVQNNVIFLTRMSGLQEPPILLDHLPIYGWRPVKLWKVGEVLKERLVVSVPKDQPDGGYSLRVSVADVTDGQNHPLLKNHGDARRPPSFVVGEKAALEEGTRLLTEAQDQLRDRHFQNAVAMAKIAAELLPGRLEPAVLTDADTAWRESLLTQVEAIGIRELPRAAAIYQMAYWRWPTSQAVLNLGHRLGQSTFSHAEALASEGRPSDAFDHYLAALIFDPTLALARQRAEALRLHRDPIELDSTHPVDPGWVRSLVVGKSHGAILEQVQKTFHLGESVICQVYWARTDRHRTEWHWYGPDGEKRYQQTQHTKQGAGLSYAFIVPDGTPGIWTVAVRVDGVPVAQMPFDVLP